MDGFKGEVRRTLQFRLSAGLVLVIVLLGLAAGIFLTILPLVRRLS